MLSHAPWVFFIFRHPERKIIPFRPDRLNPRDRLLAMTFVPARVIISR